MLGNPFVFHDKIHLVIAAGHAVPAKAGPGAVLGLNLHARVFIIVERVSQSVISIGREFVMA